MVNTTTMLKETPPNSHVKLAVVDFKSEVRHSRVIALCTNFPFILLKKKCIIYAQKTMVIGHQRVYLQICHQPHCSQITAHRSPLSSYHSLMLA